MDYQVEAYERFHPTWKDWALGILTLIGICALMYLALFL